MTDEQRPAPSSTPLESADELLERLYRNLVHIQDVTDIHVGDQAVEHMYEASKRAIVAFMDYKRRVGKLLLDTGKGCSICGQTPVVNVSGTYWLCGECVNEKITPSEKTSTDTPEELRMVIGYIVTELMVRGDPRSLPEIVETAMKAVKNSQSERQRKE